MTSKALGIWWQCHFLTFVMQAHITFQGYMNYFRFSFFKKVVFSKYCFYVNVVPKTCKLLLGFLALSAIASYASIIVSVGKYSLNYQHCNTCCKMKNSACEYFCRGWLLIELELNDHLYTAIFLLYRNLILTSYRYVMFQYTMM